MNDWKMPVLPIPGTLAIRLEDFLRAEEYPAGKNSALHIDWLLKELRNFNLLSTPTERDAREKKYKYAVQLNNDLATENEEQQKRIAELEGMLSRQIDLNIEMENKKIKFKTEVERLKGELGEFTVRLAKIVSKEARDD